MEKELLPAGSALRHALVLDTRLDIHVGGNLTARPVVLICIGFLSTSAIYVILIILRDALDSWIDYSCSCRSIERGEVTLEKK